MEQEYPKEEKRREGHVKEGHERGGGEQALHCFQIAQGQGRFVLMAEGIFAHNGVKDTLVEARLKTRANARHDPPAGIIKQAHHRI